MQTHATSEDRAARRHRPKTLTVFAAAFTAGAALAYGVDRVVDVHVVQVEPQVESEPIFVALRSLPQGAPITIWDVALKDWPKAMLPTTALKSDASLDGLVLRHPIREGQPLLSVQLVRDGAIPGPSITTLPPPTAPQAPTGAAPTTDVPAAVERFVPATPADQPLVAGGESGPGVAAAAAPDTTTAETTEPADRSVEQTAPSGTLVAIVPAPTEVAPAASSTDIDASPTAEPAAADSVGPAVTGVAAGAGTAGDPDAAAAAVETPADDADAVDVTAVSRVEPLPEPTFATPMATAYGQPTPVATGRDDHPVMNEPAPAPLAAPVPALPSTDIEGALAGVGRATPAETRVAPPQASVLDRTSEAVPPTAEPRMPRQHLVVPERIALAADASFTQPATQATAPVDQTERTANQPNQATRTANQGPTPGAAPARAATRKPTAMQPAARQSARPPRQPAAKPQTTTQKTPAAAPQTQAAAKARSAAKSPAESKPQSPMARFWNAWVPDFSGGTRSR